MHTVTVTILCLCCLCPMALVGCSKNRTARTQANYRTIEAQPLRDTDKARRYNQRGLEYMDDGEIDKAEKMFEQSLTADVEFGPAHNNLGKIFYARGDYYRAAWEFEYAHKFLPRQPEPVNNLALVHERTGELDRAIDLYRQAVGLAPDTIEYRANLARALVRRGDMTAQTLQLVEQILEQDKRPEWLKWAREHRIRLLNRLGLPADPLPEPTEPDDAADQPDPADVAPAR